MISMNEEVIIFGSRAKGNANKGSDIELAIKGRQCNNKSLQGSLSLLLSRYFYMSPLVGY